MAAVGGACIFELRPPPDREVDPCAGIPAGQVCCAAGQTTPCYSGPAGTKGVGVCAAGTRACNPDGKAFGACTGEVTPTPEDCATDADEDCDGQGCSGTPIWTHHYGDAADQVGHGVAIDSTGAALITGPFAGTIAFDHELTSRGLHDVFLAKLGADGKPIWSRQLGGAADDQSGRGPAVAVGADDAVIVGGSVSGPADLGGGTLDGDVDDAFVAKLSPDGTLVWGKRWGDASGQLVECLAVDADRNVVVSGGFGGTLDFGGEPLASAGDEDLFIAKLDPDGNRVWSHRYGDAAVQRGKSVAIDRDGNVIVVGDFEGTIDFGGKTTPLTSESGVDIFLVKLDKDGSPIWARRFGQSNIGMPTFPYQQRGTTVATDSTGGIVLSGWYHGILDLGSGFLLKTTGQEGEADVFVASFDEAGETVWGRTFGNEFDLQVGWGVAVDARDQVVVTGNVTGTVDFGEGIVHVGADPDPTAVDGFVLKLEKLGKPIWEQRIGGPDWQVGYGVAIAPTGSAVVIGRYHGDVTSLDPALPNAGGDDVFVVSLAP